MKDMQNKEIRPVVGIFSAPDPENMLLQQVKSQTLDAFEKAGAEVLLMDPSSKQKIPFEQLDGFVLMGGEDLDPTRYQQQPLKECGKLNLNRDDLEWQALEYALAHDKPVFGICRGHQLLNVFLGGSLYQDLPTQRAQSKLIHDQKTAFHQPIHGIQLQDGYLKDLLGHDALQVNSLHHQAIDRKAKGLDVLALADDGLIEAVRLSDYAYVLSVQWHPELDYDVNPDSRRIIKDFIQVCRRQMVLPETNC